ncbi:MAG: hypothetical protein N2512_01560, partial [Armatimonadetes bacterium]|nr:hypothetical protein [Armatimonadota bacterium]
MAKAIAKIGTPEAYEFLVERATGGSSEAEACRAALFEAGAAAEPFVLTRLRQEPNAVELLACLSRPLSKEAAELLVSICLRTANPWFVRWAVQRLAMDWASELPKLQKVVAQRRDRRLAGAFQIGLIAADPGRFLDRLKRYLSPEVDTVLQELALTVRAGLKLEEAQALLRQWLASASVRRRTAALRTIEHGRLVEFAGDALRAWVFDPSPSVRY